MPMAPAMILIAIIFTSTTPTLLVMETILGVCYQLQKQHFSEEEGFSAVHNANMFKQIIF